MNLISKYEVISYLNLWNKIVVWIIIKTSLSIMIVFKLNTSDYSLVVFLKITMFVLYII